MHHGHVGWAAVAGAGVVLEAYALRRGLPDATLSATVRRTFRTDTREGRMVFSMMLGGVALWFHRHILVGDC